MGTGTKKDLVIVGSGIIGLSTAYFAQERGWNVTLVDRIDEGGDNCSVGNNGMIVPSHFVPLAQPGAIGQALRWMKDPESPFSLQPSLSLEMLKWGLRFYLASTEAQATQAAPILRDLNVASRDLFLKWANQGIEAGLTERGLLLLCNSQQGLEHETTLAAQATELGVGARVLNSAELQSLEPNVRLNVLGGVHYTSDCHLDPKQLLDSLKASIQARGGKFLWSTHATGWKVDSVRIHALQTHEGEIAGDEFVVCGGVWSEALVKELHLKLPLLAGKGYSLTLDTPAKQPNHCAILSEAKVAVTPMGQKLRFGGTMTIGKPDNVVDLQKVHGIVKSVGRYLPDFTEDTFNNVSPWVGLRPVSPDGLPYVGKASEWKNLTVATGHAMMGLSLGPITGKLVTEAISSETQTLPGVLNYLSPNRYSV